MYSGHEPRDTKISQLTSKKHRFLHIWIFDGKVCISTDILYGTYVVPDCMHKNSGARCNLLKSVNHRVTPPRLEKAERGVDLRKLLVLLPMWIFFVVGTVFGAVDCKCCVRMWSSSSSTLYLPNWIDGIDGKRRAAIGWDILVFSCDKAFKKKLWVTLLCKVPSLRAFWVSALFSSLPLPPPSSGWCTWP